MKRNPKISIRKTELLYFERLTIQLNYFRYHLQSENMNINKNGPLILK